MWKKRKYGGFIKRGSALVSFALLTSISHGSEPTEILEFLDCETQFTIEEGYSYPIKLKQFSKFQIGKKIKQDIFQFDFLIDSMFKFPTKNTSNRVTPRTSKSEKLICYTDYLPETMSYLYENAKNSRSDVLLYLFYDNDYKTNIFIK